MVLLVSTALVIQIAKLKLPSNYSRFLTEDKEHVVYLNTHTH